MCIRDSYLSVGFRRHPFSSSFISSLAGGIAARAATANAAAAARPDERPRTLVIVVETAQTTVRVIIDPADPRAAVVAAPLPAALSEVVAVRLEV